MSTFVNLAADPEVMRAGNTNFLTDESGRTMSNTTLISQFKAEAKIKLKRDLINALGIDQENTTDIDDVVALNEQELKEALAKLQLHYLFLNFDSGDASMARFRASLYLNDYNEYKSRFPKLMIRSLAESYTVSGGIKFG
jgi:hypothetical protein